MQKPLNYILPLLACLLACPTQETKSLVRRALTQIAPTKITKTIAQPINWIAQTKLYKKHPWLVKTGAIIATGFLVKKTYDAYISYKRFSQNQRNNELVEAVRSRNTKRVDNLLKKGANINAQPQSLLQIEEPLLHIAIKNRDLAMVKKLINAKADLESRDFLDRTPLAYACEQNDTQIALELIAAGALVNSTGNANRTALMYACMKNNIEVTNVLLAKGVVINAKDSVGYTALSHTCYHAGKANSIIAKLIQAGADVNVDCSRHKTLLQCAAEDNDLERVTMLLNAGASVDARLSDNQETALITACFHNNTEIAQTLIKAGADVNATGPYTTNYFEPRYTNTVNITPLMLADAHKNTWFVYRLLAARAYPVGAAKAPQNCFAYAMKKRNFEVMKKIIDANTRVVSEDYYSIFDKSFIDPQIENIKLTNNENDTTPVSDQEQLKKKIRDDMRSWIHNQYQEAHEKMNAHLQDPQLPTPLWAMVAAYGTGSDFPDLPKPEPTT